MCVCVCVCQVIRVLGLLGALDPHKHRMNMGQDQASEAAVSKSEKKPEEGGKGDCWLSLRVACVTSRSGDMRWCGVM